MLFEFCAVPPPLLLPLRPLLRLPVLSARTTEVVSASETGGAAVEGVTLGRASGGGVREGGGKGEEEGAPG